MFNSNPSTIPTIDYYQTVLSGFYSYQFNNQENDLEKNIFISKIKNFILLDENWDSYEALKISKTSIENSCSFIQKLYNFGYRVYFVAPTPDGEVFVELKNKNKSAEIQFFQNSKAVFTIFEDGNLIKEADIKSDNDIKDLLHLLYN